ncbi:MAG TPA: hypothetical protein VGQ91_01415 [Ideonella sp.]|nr:hypothetical protein [Ideonella sp.]
MPPPRLIQRLLRQEPTASALPSRTFVRPPAIWGQAEPIWKALWGWLRARPSPEHRRVSALDAARQDFALALADLDEVDAADLRRRGLSARSLRELWHLRAELYSIVARHRSQGEAIRRLDLVNRHFPVRSTPTTTAGPRAGQRFDD